MYLLSNKATQDLSDIWYYSVETWSENQADKYYHTLTTAFNEISKNPIIGKRYDEVKAGLLGYRIQRHIIFYRITQPDSIEIIRILHDSMDLKRRIND